MFCKNPSIVFKSNRTWPSCNSDKVYTLKPELLKNPTMYQQSPTGMLYGYKKDVNNSLEEFKVNNLQETCNALPVAIGLGAVLLCFICLTKQK